MTVMKLENCKYVCMYELSMFCVRLSHFIKFDWLIDVVFMYLLIATEAEQQRK